MGTAAGGDYQHEALAELMALDPDVILIAGDLYQGGPEPFASQVEPFRRLLRGLQAPGGVYFVRGDTDPQDVPMAMLEGTGVELLDDEVATVDVGDRRLRIGGVKLAYGRSRPEAARVYEELEGAPEGEVTIALAHRPDAVFELQDGSGVDLVVAGHTHGGQIALPGIGPLTTMSGVPRAVAAGGLHEVEGFPIYVSTGVGMERNRAPQVRLFTQPSVTVLTLR